MDTDSDGIGNNADTDDDGDNILDTADGYPLVALGDRTDTDGDGRPNDCDSDCQATGMTADLDDDQDGVSDFGICVEQNIIDDFTINPNWQGSRNSSQFGYLSGSNKAGGSAGEIGGVFQKDSANEHYGFSFCEAVDFTKTLTAHGKIGHTESSNADFGGHMILGFYSSDSRNKIGIQFGSDGSYTRWAPRVVFNDSGESDRSETELTIAGVWIGLLGGMSQKDQMEEDC